MENKKSIHSVTLISLGTALWIVLSVNLGKGVLTSRFPQWLPEAFSSSGANSWDGYWYEQIATEGYFHTYGSASNVAFFPAYPLCANVFSRVFHCSVELSLRLLSNIFFLLSVLVFRKIVCVRNNPETFNRFEINSVLALCLWPVGLFSRMAYSESLFLLLVLLSSLAILKQLPPWIVAVLIGATTACRSVGVAFLPVFWLYLWDQHLPQSRIRPRLILQAVFLTPFACWGLLAYMGYLHVEFGDALVFAKTQDQFFHRPTQPFPDRLISLLTGEPIWSVYVPGNQAYWASDDLHLNPLFSIKFANPIFFVFTLAMVLLGAWKRWIDQYELILSLGLLLIPYVMHSYQFLFMSQGRFTSVVFPLYIVLGKLVSKSPLPLQIFFYSFCAILLSLYSALFSAWYPVF